MRKMTMGEEEALEELAGQLNMALGTFSVEHLLNKAAQEIGRLRGTLAKSCSDARAEGAYEPGTGPCPEIEQCLSALSMIASDEITSLGTAKEIAGSMVARFAPHQPTNLLK